MHYLFRESPHYFFELLVLLEDETFVLPSKFPERYQSRAKFTCTEGTDTLSFIYSSAHSSSTRTNRNLLKQGIWICEGDCEVLGGVNPSVFGMPLSLEASKAFINKYEILLQQYKGAQPIKKTRIAYHGTSFENYLGICAQGLKCSYGMLGTGVYLGSFWKASRFAARDQHYKFRETPSVLRVVWLCEDEDMLHFPRKIMYCFCAECYLRPEQRSFCGHTMDWQSDAKVFPEKMQVDRSEGQGTRYWAGSLKPCKFPDSEKWVTQNEEWVINPSCIIRLGECATLNLDSVEQTHYNPMQRNIKIL
jgi:hypothetical protein